MKSYLLPITFAFAAVIPVSAANLLLTNPNFETPTPSASGGDVNGNIFVSNDAITTTTTTAVPGWRGVIAPGSAFANFVGTATNQNNIGNTRFAYTSGNAFFETAAANRAIVSAGDYTFSYSMRKDTATPTAFVFVDWFNSGGTLVSSSSNFGSDVGTTTSPPNPQTDPATFPPFGNFSHTVTAPVGATAAGVRWGTTSGGIIADNFFLDVVPEPSSALLGGLGLGLALLRRTRN